MTVEETGHKSRESCLGRCSVQGPVIPYLLADLLACLLVVHMCWYLYSYLFV